MNTSESKYTQFALCREMLETPRVMREFRASETESLVELARGRDQLMFTGEGSSRIFPAKRTRVQILRQGTRQAPIIEGATQAMEYSLDSFAVLGASNSGRTRELIRLFKYLSARGHQALGAVTAHSDTPISDVAAVTHVLGCGPEDATAATKSVVEQGLVWHAVGAMLGGGQLGDPAGVAECVEQAMVEPVPEELARALSGASTVFFAGRNDGVAEELALKTNEIVRLPTQYLEGTYAVHGVEEVMTDRDIVVLVEPFADEEDKIAECLESGVGATVMALSTRETRFPTIRVPTLDSWSEYVLLAAGWNLLVEAGLLAGVDLDHPIRARKIGNE